MSTQHFLVEIGTEELPPKALKKLSASFTQGIVNGLKEANIAFDHQQVRSFATPRRLAVSIADVATTQPDKNIEKLGPAVAAAFDAEGNPSKAALGFAKSNNSNIEDLARVETDKGERLCFRSLEKGRATSELLEPMNAPSPIIVLCLANPS